MARRFIHTWAGINGQNNDPTNSDWINNLTDEVKPITPPDYKQYIEGVPLRRLSKILKKSVACAQTVQRGMDGLVLEGIIVATGLGCLDDTRKFLIESHEHESPSPTPFIHSTHNTIAGQLGLHMKCHGYNITHSNVGACFEGALLDATLQEGQGWYLVGSVDEMIDWLNLLMLKSDLSNIKLGSGTSFFAVSQVPSDVEIVDVASWLTNGKSIETLCHEFLEENNVNASIDLILTNKDVQFKEIESLNYQDYCGAYLTNSGFGLELGAQKIKAGYKQVLIVNAIQEGQIGLTLLKHA